MGVHKTVNGAYRYRYAPFLISTYYVMGCSPLALPLGELSPQVTERVLQPFSNDKINLCTHITEIPVAHGVSSPCEAAGHFLIEHCLLVWSLVALSVLATLGHLSQRERQGMLARYTERRIEVRFHQFGKLEFTARYGSIGMFHLLQQSESLPFPAHADSGYFS